jgi:hypothetical protein
MNLPFGLYARGLAISTTAVFFLAAPHFQHFFKAKPSPTRPPPTKQQRLEAVQLRVAKTALAHRDYGAAIDLFGEAAQNQTTRKTALLQLGKLYGLTDNRQAELATYQTLLKEYPDDAETRDRTAALSAQTGAKPAKPNKRVSRNHVEQPQLNLNCRISMLGLNCLMKLGSHKYPSRCLQVRKNHQIFYKSMG